MPRLDCDVCGRDVDRNFNASRLQGRYAKVAVLCFLHAHACDAVAVKGVVNWLAMGVATLWLREEEPDLLADPDAYTAWDPLPRLIALYPKALEQYPDDLPPP